MIFKFVESHKHMLLIKLLFSRFQVSLLQVFLLAASLVLIILHSTGSAASLQTPAKPDLLLANTYQGETDVSEYWISEKYDGVRAYWDGKHFISRQGNIYHAPAWFLDNFPKVALDGELWIARNQFEALISVVRKDHPIDSEWKQVRYKVFELPNGEGSFSQRLQQLDMLLNDHPSPYIQLIEQFRVDSHKALIARLNEIVRQGGEGLMMHRADAPYHTGRSDDLLKVKLYQDAEATILKHMPGKGKYLGMLGSLLVENKEGKRFKIGSGLRDSERKNPPPVGAVVTYKYYGLTNNGIPRFATFLRQRKD